MSTEEKICIIHTANVQGPILRITDQTWKKILDASCARLKSYKYSKYDSICKSLQKDYDVSKHGYHRVCYKNFTAIQKIVGTETSQSSTSEYNLESNDSPASSAKIATNTGFLEKICIFCGNKRKKVKGKEEVLGQCQTKDAENNIKSAAHILQDQNLFLKISNDNLVANEVYYHHSCRKLYLKSASSQESENKQDSTIERSRKVFQEKHNRAFNKTIDYVKEYIIALNKAQKLTSIHSRHFVYLSEEGIDDPSYSTQKLLDKLTKYFGPALKTTKSSNKLGVILYSNRISSIEAEALANNCASQIEAQVEEVALYLRRQIFQLSACPKLDHPVNIHDILSGENKPPEMLELFFRTLYSGTSKAGSEKLERRISSSSQDAIFIASNGRLKPKKHLLLGLGIKSMTGSRKVLEILNHWGHCISYHTSEELETDFALSLLNQQGVTPENISRRPGLFTGLAWDNFDSNLETLSGKGSLHDTFGICYQNLVSKEPENETMDVEEGILTEKDTGSRKPQRKMRSLKIHSKALEPYPKKPKLVRPLCTLTNIRSITNNFGDAMQRDFTWMLSVQWEESTPMWAGWNSKVCEDYSLKQKIGYMTNITLPPTRTDVVLETMKISQQVAAECGDSSILVHYDLAVAKPAILIQNQESPRFDNLFICFGSFHIELAYFGALGYYLEGSGIEHILSESGVLASGSLQGFLRGKHFNRCKRVHILLSLSLESCLFQKFIQQEQNIKLFEELKKQVSQLNADLSKDTFDKFSVESHMKQVYVAFNTFKHKTRAGYYGKTAQFYQLYIDLVDIYKLFSRAYRTNNLDMYIDALEKMLPVFFSGKRLNYARWMTVYLLKLQNLGTDLNLTEVVAALSQGGLGIKRSNNSFSRVPVDMALEQTVNADAASRFTGITAFANSESARARWMITRSLRSELVSSLLENSGITKPPDSKHDLQRGRIEKDHRDIGNIISTLNSFSNPFHDLDPEEPLRNISTGHKINEKVTQDILSFYSKGQEVSEKYKTMYVENPRNIEKPIPRQLVANCVSSIASTSLKKERKKLDVAKCTLDAFGKVIHMASASKKCDLKKVMAYPLTCVPFSLAQIGGSMNKTDKSRLMHMLEEYQNIDDDHGVSTRQPQIHVAVYDAMFLLHTLKFPETYGALARKLLEHIIYGTSAKEVHLVFDSYGCHSIKDCEHESRKTVLTRDIKVTGADQKTPTKAVDALRSEQFKTSLTSFLCNEWKSQSYVSLLAGKVLFVGAETVCYKYTSTDSSVEATEVPDLSCHHQEADTRIIWHVQYVTSGSEQTKNILVRANDTDVLILLIYHHKHFPNSQVWFDCGLCSNNSRRTVNVTLITQELGRDLVEALPGYHAFTGTDFTAAFSRIGKVKPFKTMKKNLELIEVMSQLGKSLTLTNETIIGLEKFVCAMYRHPKHLSVNEVRYILFMKRTTPKNHSKSSSKIKGIDPTMLPPSKAALVQKIKRSNAVSWLWKRANSSKPSDGFEPTKHGWYTENDYYHIHWYDGPTLPDDLKTSTEDSEEEESDFDTDDSSSSEHDDIQ